MTASSTPRETWELNAKVSALSFSPRKRNTNCCVKLWRTKTSSGVAGGLPIKGGERQRPAPIDQAKLELPWGCTGRCCPHGRGPCWSFNKEIHLLIHLLSFRLYETAEEDSLPDILKKFLQFLCSEALFLLLSNFTGLKLHFLAPSDEDEDAGEGRAADTAGHSSPKPEQEETEQHADGNPCQPDQPDNIPEAQSGKTQNGKSSSSSSVKGLEQNPDVKDIGSRIPSDFYGTRISPPTAASTRHQHKQRT